TTKPPLLLEVAEGTFCPSKPLNPICSSLFAASNTSVFPSTIHDFMDCRYSLSTWLSPIWSYLSHKRYPSSAERRKETTDKIRKSIDNFFMTLNILISICLLTHCS